MDVRSAGVGDGQVKAIGYAGGRLFGCTYNGYSVVICAPDEKTAREAFVFFLNDRHHTDTIYTSGVKIKPAKTLGARPLFWAQVDVAAV